MSRGKRYSKEPKLNIKKVLAVIILIVVVIMVIYVMKALMTKEETGTGKVAALNYFPVYTNEKWGVIDSLGRMTIDANFDEMIIVPNKTEDIFICTYDVDYETGSYKTKVINSKNKEIFTEYDLVEPVYNYDKNQSMWYEQNILKVKQNGQYGLINLSGKKILDCKYDKIEAIKGIENSLLIEKDGKVGLCNSDGNIIIDVNYKNISALGEDYKNGYIVTNEDGKYGVIDVNKTIILEPEYDDILPVYGNGKYVVKENGKYELIDKEKQVLISDGFDEIEEINGEQVIIKKNGKYGVINLEKEEIISTNYDELDYISNENYIAKKAGKYGVISTEEKELLPFEYISIIYRKQARFIEAEKENAVETEIYNEKLELKKTGIIAECNETKGYIRLRENGEYNYYNLKFEKKDSKDLLTSNTLFLSKKNGKYGYIDKNGNVVVNYIYDDATEQNSYGYASVKKDGKWGSIDGTGKIVVDPKYSLENNLKIDFIGKWHLAEDLNANYYTDN